MSHLECFEFQPQRHPKLNVYSAVRYATTRYTLEAYVVLGLEVAENQSGENRNLLWLKHYELPPAPC